MNPELCAGRLPWCQVLSHVRALRTFGDSAFMCQYYSSSSSRRLGFLVEPYRPLVIDSCRRPSRRPTDSRNVSRTQPHPYSFCFKVFGMIADIVSVSDSPTFSTRCPEDEPPPPPYCWFVWCVPDVDPDIAIWINGIAAVVKIRVQWCYRGERHSNIPSRRQRGGLLYHLWEPQDMVPTRTKVLQACLVSE